jgi:Na+-transporting methylmalonyl-CoA/oxaloacetate decarboxylase gamma subunit
MTTWGTIFAVISIVALALLFVSEVRKGWGDSERERRALEEAEKNHDGAHLADVIAGKIECRFCLPNHRRIS